MKKIITLIFVSTSIGCASANLAKNFSVLSFDDKSSSTDSLKSIGSIDGKDCTWYVFGWSIGESPNARNAFQNAMSQKEMNLIPGQAKVAKGEPLKAVKNVSVASDGFNAWVASRYCVVVTGVGLQ